MNTLLIKLGIAALVALLLFGSGGFVVWKYQAAQVAAARERVDHLAETIRELQAARLRADAASTAARKQKDELAKRHLQLESQLGAALSTERAWADTPVPRGVQDALQ